MIKGNTVSVIITSYGTDEERERVLSILKRLRNGAPPTRNIMRALQPYTVSVYEYKISEYLKDGYLLPKSPEGIIPGLWEWVGKYDDVSGLSLESKSIDEYICGC